ncbi:MAG: hypothetical protein KGI54_16665 [Pseudomonadota bacterium]|nr:hypothetical protein [Pseudomonadota bacterium]
MSGTFKRPSDDQKTEAVFNRNCAAFGCSLPGVFADSVHGSNTWYCRNHSRSYGVAHDEITVKIKQYQWMLGIAEYLESDMQSREKFSAIRDRAEKRFSDAGFDLAMERDKSVSVWIRRIYGKFDSLVSGRKDGQQFVRKPAAAPNVDRGPVAVGDLMPSIKDRQYAD